MSSELSKNPTKPSTSLYSPAFSYYQYEKEQAAKQATAQQKQTQTTTPTQTQVSNQSIAQEKSTNPELESAILQSYQKQLVSRIWKG